VTNTLRETTHGTITFLNTEVMTWLT